MNMEEEIDQEMKKFKAEIDEIDEELDELFGKKKEEEDELQP